MDSLLCLTHPPLVQRFRNRLCVSNKLIPRHIIQKAIILNCWKIGLWAVILLYPSTRYLRI